jgi:two-component system phosphate regulon sensor histidine kinase PhoR
VTSNSIRRLIISCVIAIASAVAVLVLVRGYSLSLILAGAASALAVSAIIYMFVPAITDDELELELAMKKLGGGESPDKVRLMAIGELADVKHAFNEMAKRLGDRLKNLETTCTRLEAMLSGVADGVFLVDRRAEILRVNNAASAMFDLGGKAEGRTFIEAIRDHEFDILMQKCLASGLPQEGIIEDRPRKKIFGVFVSPLKKETGAVMVVRDLTEKRRLEKMRRDFVANISHELRTPVASLKLLAETLKGGALEDPAVAGDYLNRIEAETDKLSQMVQELGELSSIESGQAPIIKQPLEVKPFIESIIERLRPLADRAGLELLTDVAGGLKQVSADAQRIEQVLVNLIHNSIKFTPAGGRITVGARAKTKGLEVFVTDTGIGIAPDDLPRIFERFYKADKARTSGGTGLGLAIAKHIVQAHGGEIRADSPPGAGAIFSFTLPG